MQGDNIVMASATARALHGSVPGGNLLLADYLRLIERAADDPGVVGARGLLDRTEMLGAGERSNLQVEMTPEIDVTNNFQLPLPIRKQQGIDVHVAVFHAEAHRARPELAAWRCANRCVVRA